MKRKILIGVIAVSFLIVLASFPSVVARQTNQPLEITPEIRDIIGKKLKDINDDFTLEWERGLVIYVFLRVVELYIDYLIKEGWFFGVSLLFLYIFIAESILHIILHEPKQS